MTSTRQPCGACRVWTLDAGEGPATPDLQLELEDFERLKLRNFSPQPLRLRFNLSGADATAAQQFRIFEFGCDPVNLPGLATLRLHPQPNRGGFRAELDADSDGKADAVNDFPARGNLRASHEGGVLALRWRRAASQETLERTRNLGQGAWETSDAKIENEGGDRSPA